MNKYLKGKKALQVFLTEEEHMELKLLCTKKGVTMTSFVSKLVKEKVAKDGKLQTV